MEQEWNEKACWLLLFCRFSFVSKLLSFDQKKKRKEKKFGCEILIYLLPLVKFLDMWAFIQFFIIII